MRRAIAGGVGLAAAAVGGALAYTVAQVQGRAVGDVQEFLAGPRPAAAPVVCLGASIVRGRASVDWVEMLRARFPERPFVNAGVNGNVVWEVSQRLDDVLDCHPIAVVILIGTNDVQSTLSDQAGQSCRRSKHLPRVPDLDWYAQCLADVVTRLTAAGVRVGLCSLPPIGQDLEAQVNMRVVAFNAEIREVALATGAAYLPVHERLVDLLRSQGAIEGPAWTGSAIFGLASLTRHFLLGQSYDRIALSRDLLLSPDGVHLDTSGATIVADVVAGFVESIQSTGE